MTRRTPTVLGLCSFTHDSAAVLIVDGALVGFVEEERLNGDKHTTAYPEHAIGWLLDRAGLTAGQVDVVAYNFDGRRYLDALPATDLLARIPAARGRAQARADSFRKVHDRFGLRMAELRARFPHARIAPVLHHRAHGLYAFASSPFEEAAVLVVDSLGEVQTTTIAQAQRAGDGCRYRIEEDITDPDSVGMKVALGEVALKELAASQRSELSRDTFDKVLREAAKATGDKRVSASMLGLGGIPPSLEALAGVACHRIIRSHALSFATLRQMRFGAGAEGDAACRALLAALALNALARSDAELYLRANCDLVQRRGSAKRMEIDRGADRLGLDPLSVPAADALLADALEAAGRTAGVRWDGVVMRVAGNPAIAVGAVDEEDMQ